MLAARRLPSWRTGRRLLRLEGRVLEAVEAEKGAGGGHRFHDEAAAPGAEADQLQRRVGLTDRRKLDEYFSSIREIEKRIERSEHEDAQAMPDLDVPHGRVESFREHARLMYDLMVVAFRTDTTRVATFMLDNAGGRRRYTEIGATDAHHSLSHHRDRRATIEQLQKIDQYLVDQFAYFLGQLW